MLGRGSGFRYAYTYTGFICAPWDDAMSYPQMQRLHRVSADVDSAVAAIAAGMRDGRAIAERCFPAFLEGGADGAADAPHLTAWRMPSATEGISPQPFWPARCRSRRRRGKDQRAALYTSLPKPCRPFMPA